MRYATNAARPPSSTTARITLNRLMTQAIPMPRAAHYTHQSPGEVIRLTKNRKTISSGAMNRNFSD